MVTCTHWWLLKPLKTTQDATPAWHPTVSEQTIPLLRFTSKVSNEMDHFHIMWKWLLMCCNALQDKVNIALWHKSYSFCTTEHWHTNNTCKNSSINFPCNMLLIIYYIVFFIFYGRDGLYPWISNTAFVFVPLQELHHQTQKEKERQSPDQEPCLSKCVSVWPLVTPWTLNPWTG